MDFENPKFKEVFFNIYNALSRGGPGGTASTQKAFEMMRELPVDLKILDVGCGPGKQTLDLAGMTKGEIIAIDNHSPFIDRLSAKIQTRGLGQRITAMNADMFHLEFPKEHFNVIWSEGAIYQMGFENGIRTLGEFLKPGGYFAVTEAVWLKPNPPQELKKNWAQEYPDMKNIAENIKIIQQCGYQLAGYFTLPNSDWLDDFYIPMQARIAVVKERYQNDTEAMDLMPRFENEITIFNKYSDYFGYEFFIFRK